MKIKKIFIYLLIMFYLFQDSISKMIKNSIVDNLDEMLVVILFLWAMYNIFKKKKISKTTFTIMIFTCLFSIIGIISCFVNSEFIISRVFVSNFLAIKFFILIISVSSLDFSESDKKIIINAIEFCCKLVMLVAIFNFIAPNIYSKVCPFAIVTYRFGLVSVTSLFYHTGRYGWFMLFMALLYYSKYKLSNDKKDKHWMILCILFSILSLRTKVIMSLIVIIVYECIINKKINIKKVLTSVAALACIAFIFRNVISNTYKLYFTDEEGTSARQALFDNGVKIMKDYFPIGVGFGQYGSWYARVYYSSYYYKYNMTKVYGLSPDGAFFGTDSFWSSIFGETGASGTLIYIALLIYIFRKLQLKKSQNEQCGVFILWAILAFLQTICESMGEPSFNSPPQNLFVALIIGIAFSNAKTENKVVNKGDKYNEKNCNFYA